MKEAKTVILDGNEAAASVAYRLAEVVAIYPITPSSPMARVVPINGTSEGKKNIWGAVPSSKNSRVKAALPALSTVPCRQVHSPPRSQHRRDCC